MKNIPAIIDSISNQTMVFFATTAIGALLSLTCVISMFEYDTISSIEKYSSSLSLTLIFITKIPYKIIKIQKITKIFFLYFFLISCFVDIKVSAFSFHLSLENLIFKALYAANASSFKPSSKQHSIIL